jgi:hypothetical protein
MIYSITFEENFLAKVLDALSRFPHNQVHEILAHITSQVIEQQQAHAAEEAQNVSFTVEDDLGHPVNRTDEQSGDFGIPGFVQNPYVQQRF